MPIRFLVGLGNPGPEYEYSRHNVGFRVIDEAAAYLGPLRWQDIGPAWIATGRICDQSVRLVLPSTFMNRSGAAAIALCREFDAEPDEILFVVDDVDLDLGRLRLRRSGGPGTHNGLRSISQAIGDDYPRLRVGVKGPAVWPNLADFVLADFTDDEVAPVLASSHRGFRAMQTAVCQDLDRAMNQFNQKP